jgi:hypothetical protein
MRAIGGGSERAAAQSGDRADRRLGGCDRSERQSESAATNQDGELSVRAKGVVRLPSRAK